MSKLKNNLLKLINKIFNRNNNIELFPITKNENALSKIIIEEVIKDFENKINNELNISRLDSLYNKKLDNEKYNYNISLSSKLSKEQIITLSKSFFSSLDKELSEKANEILSSNNFIFDLVLKNGREEVNKSRGLINNQNGDFSQITGNLQDLYNVVQKVIHKFDFENVDTEAEKIFGEVVPQCMENMLNEFLLNLSDEDIKNYGIDRDTLMHDIRKRKISTFLVTKDNIRSFNSCSGDKELNLRNILAQIYSTKFMKLDNEARITELHWLKKYIECNDIVSCSKTFRVDLENKLKMQFIISDIVKDIKNISTQIFLQEEYREILEKAIKGKNFQMLIGKQNIHVNLESRIPFILIEPRCFEDGQTLVMESNNLETNDKKMLLKQALDTGRRLNNILNRSNPILIPILPSESLNEPYYQQLSLECFNNGERPDLDVVEVIEKAKEIISREYGIKLKDKIFLNGYSTSGVFAQRFSLIHPELIDTVCIGGASGSIPIPNTDLDYPLGIKNYEELFGKRFNIEEYKKINFNYYVGSLECEEKSFTRTDENGDLAPKHDMSFFNRSIPFNIGKAQREKLGKNLFERADKTVHILKDMGVNITHKVIPNRTHNDKEAVELMENNSNYKNIKGIQSEQGKIIATSFKKILQKQYTMNKENIKL